MGLWGAGWVKNLSVGIGDGAPSTAHSSLALRLSPREYVRFIDKANLSYANTMF